MKHLLLAILLTVATASAESPEVPDFSKYPKSVGFDRFISQHRASEFSERRVRGFHHKSSASEPLLIAISHFWRADSDSAIEYFVNPSGYVITCREIYDVATQASQEKQLTWEQLTDLRKAITKLPETNSYPPFGRLVIVSFRTDGRWVTRTCTLADVKEIYAIIGERFETARQSL